MDKIIVSITAVTIILILLLASCWWYKYYIPSAKDDVLYVMRMSRNRLLIGIPCIIFFSIMDVVSVIFLDAQTFVAFVIFYFFTLLGVYLCIAIQLWRGMIRSDSLTLYMPLLPAKEIKFYEIDFVHYTDNNTYGLSGQKTLAGYRGKKKLFSIEEDIIGFQFLCALLCERGKVEYIPVTENPTAEKIMKRVPVVEIFSVTAKTGNKVRDIIFFLFLALCFAYILWDRAEFELGYQIIAVVMLPLSFLELLSELLWKVTVDFHTISIRNSLGIVKTYEIRQITEVAEFEQHIILYAGQKKVVKIAKSRKNFQYLFERLLRSEAKIYRKY